MIDIILFIIILTLWILIIMKDIDETKLKKRIKELEGELNVEK